MRPLSKFRAELYEAILKLRQALHAEAAADDFGGGRSRGSVELLNGRIAGKSVDKLLYYAGRLGIEAKTKFTRTHKEVMVEELAVVDGK